MREDERKDSSPLSPLYTSEQVSSEYALAALSDCNLISPRGGLRVPVAKKPAHIPAPGCTNEDIAATMGELVQREGALSCRWMIRALCGRTGVLHLHRVKHESHVCSEHELLHVAIAVTTPLQQS